jgi:Holliday junction resolvase RusA-like endonuclease
MRPCAWQRAGKNGKVHFTPKATANFESAVKLYARQAMASNEIFDEPLDVTVNFVYALPKNATKHAKEEVKKGIYYVKTTKPDIDNLVKAVLDGMNGVVYRDDALVWCLTAMKTYHETDEIRITVSSSKNEAKDERSE